MGSGPKGKDKGRPETVVESGTPSSSGPKGEPEQALTIPLVEIDTGVWRTAHVGDPVRIASGSTIEVHTDDGRLGNVPEYLEDEVRTRAPSGGVVARLSENPLAADVMVK